jgi:glycosyltransferase involved in cell wall biosynthesis
VEAFRMLRERGYNIKMLIVGRGNQKFIDFIKEKVKEYKLEDFVEWRSFKNTPSEIYEGIDVVVAPSTLNEAFGLMACEANMFSMPSVVSEKGGQQEIIIDGYNGFKVNPLNPATIAEKLARLYEDRTLVKSMGENGRKRVIEVFSIEKMNNDFNALLQNINTNQ